MTRKLRTEPRAPQRMFENIGPGHGLKIQQADACNRGAAVEADTIRRAVEADAIGSSS